MYHTVLHIYITPQNGIAPSTPKCVPSHLGISSPHPSRFPRAECTFKPQINKTSSSLAQKTAAISFRHGRRAGLGQDPMQPRKLLGWSRGG